MAEANGHLGGSDSGDGSRSPTLGQAAMMLRTTHCTSCDYSLEGLPRDGKCPECGMSIDDRFLVLRGYGAGRQASAFNAHPRRVPLVMLSAGGGLLIQLLINLMINGFRRSWLLPSVGLVLLVSSAWILLRRSNLSGLPAQLWIGSEGFWFRDRAAIFTGRTWSAMGWSIVSVVLVVAAAFAFAASVIVGFVVILLFGLFGLLASWTYRNRRRDTVAIKLDGVGTAVFYRWSMAQFALVKVRADGWGTLTIDPKPASFWTLQANPPTSILFEPSIGDPNAVQLFVHAAMRSGPDSLAKIQQRMRLAGRGGAVANG